MGNTRKAINYLEGVKSEIIHNGACLIGRFGIEPLEDALASLREQEERMCAEENGGEEELL